MAYDESLAQRVRSSLLTGHPAGFDEKPMMGGLCFLVEGKMCVCVKNDRLMARIDPDEEEEALGKPGCELMVHGGRRMKGFVWVSSEGLKTSSALQYWVRLALAYNPKAQSSRASAAKKKPKRRRPN